MQLQQSEISLTVLVLATMSAMCRLLSVLKKHKLMMSVDESI
jgi:hypothetical protein